MKHIVQKTVLLALQSRPGRLLTIQELFDAVYGDDPDGGSLWANNSIREAVSRLRAQHYPILHVSGYVYPARVK